MYILLCIDLVIALYLLYRTCYLLSNIVKQKIQKIVTGQVGHILRRQLERARLAKGPTQPGQGSASALEFDLGQDVGMYLCFMGQKAASGRRRILVTTQTEDMARRLAAIMWSWRVPVPGHISQSGERHMGVKFWRAKDNHGQMIA